MLPEGEREERWLEHWSQPIRAGMYAGGRIEQYMDITDRKKLEIAEEAQRQFAEALRDISTVLTSTLDLKEVLGRILTSLERIVPHDSASIIMLEEDRLWVAEQHHDGNGNVHDTVTERQMQFEYRAYLEAMIASQNPLVVPDLHADLHLLPAEQHERARGYVAAPIRLKNETIGFLNVFSQEAGFYSKTHADRLMTFAELAAIAIQNARLFHQSQALATFQERQRLARDLHDSVSQTLFTCRTMAETALRRWEKDPERAHELVREVYRLTITALAEMRILLLELRPAWLTRVSLKQLFEQYLLPIQTRRQFTLHLAIDDVPTLPSDVQIALYRIVQESLNNIDKHARARNVIVSARDLDEHLELQISDDGVGFDLEAVPSTSLGLGIIRERAESIRADVKIESRVGEGTRITVNWQKQAIR
ncbi:MAG: GAF domain-containing sensor histidine kinase [Chloroflexi bacterium]|nr:GAF domain-containing sensor histidine kinase [Chloroflexota bacterium]